MSVGSSNEIEQIKPKKITAKFISLLRKMVLHEAFVYNPIIYKYFFRNLLKKYNPKPGLFPFKNAGEQFKRLNQKYKFSLIVMHYLGTIDSAQIIKEAQKLNIPYIFINHFSNHYFKSISIREQLIYAAGIAGVNDIEVPKRLKSQFVNVSNGIDIDIFDPQLAKMKSYNSGKPIIIYPARIIHNKGQLDLIKAYIDLKKRGFHANIVFAGRIDSKDYEIELRELAQKNNLADDVQFLGQLNEKELRDWYGISSVMAFINRFMLGFEM